MKDTSVDYEQCQQASAYVEGYFKFAGLKYPYDMPEGDIPKAWPADVKAAIETMRAFNEQLEEEGIKI